MKNKHRGNVTTKESPNTHLKKKKKREKENIQERRRAIESVTRMRRNCLLLEALERIYKRYTFERLSMNITDVGMN